MNKKNWINVRSPTDLSWATFQPHERFFMAQLKLFYKFIMDFRDVPQIQAAIPE